MSTLATPRNLLSAINRIFAPRRVPCDGNALRTSLCDQNIAQRLEARQNLRHLPEYLLRDMGL